MDNLPARRPRGDAVVAGVCSGLARRWNIDPNLLRIAVVLLSFASGLGVIAYAACVALMPREGRPEAPVRRLLPFTREWSTPTLVMAVIGAGVAGFAILGGFTGGTVFPALVFLGLWLLISRRRRAAARPRTAEPTPFERAAEAWRHRLIEHQRRTTAPPIPASPTTPATRSTPVALVGAGQDDAALGPVAPRKRRRGRASLWWLALTLAAIGTGALLVGPASRTDALPYLAVVLLGLGVTLLVATWRGRPRLMGTATVLVMLATLATMAFPPVASMGAPVQENLVITTAAELPAQLSSVAGNIDLDLSGLALTEDAALKVDLGAGNLDVQLPIGLRSEVNWNVSAGQASIAGETDGGLSQTGSREFEFGDPNGPTLHLDLTVAAGNLTVRT